MADQATDFARLASERRRRGCLGCLTRVIGTLVVLTLVGCIGWVALVRILYPWAFYFGGHSHSLPLWQGIAHAHTDRGDYTLTLYLEPTNSGSRVYNLPTVKGSGYLCTPNGERYRLFVRGGFHEKVATDLNGKTMTLWYYRRPALGGITGPYEQPPRLALRGQWQNHDLVMDDGGSLADAFQPDGSPSKSGHTYYQDKANNKVPIVFREVSVWRRWDDRCQAN
jgi:hypothetical protein